MKRYEFILFVVLNIAVNKAIFMLIFHFIVSKRLIKLWKNNFNNYLSSENDGYTNQPLEVDANAFTYIVMLVLFNREITVKCNQKLLNKRIKELTLDFSKDEILDSYNYYF